MSRHLVIWRPDKLFVNSICSKCNFHPRRISSICPYLTTEACHSAVVSLVLSTLDYCNVLLAGLPTKQISRLQRLQNWAARLVTLTPKNFHITPVLMELHWLPITDCITYKLCLYVYKALNGLAPLYIAELLHLRTRNPRLRQLHDSLQLAPPPLSLALSKKSFTHAAPTLWNALPLNLRASESLAQFRRNLKTHLFTSRYCS